MLMLPSCCSHTRKMLQRMGARWEMLAQRCVMLVSSLILTVSDPVTPGQPSFLKVSSGTNPSMVGLQPLPKPRFLISTFYQTWQQSLNHSFSWSQFLPLNGTYSLFLLPALAQARPVHSRWLAPLWGMDFLWHSDCSPGFFPIHSTL